MWFRIVFLLLGILAIQAQAEEAATRSLDIKTEKPADEIKMTIDKDTATLDVFSKSGIGGGTITTKTGKWPTTAIVRFHFRGLELFSISNGKVKLSGSVLSHSGNPKLLNVTQDGKEKKVEKGSPYWTEVQVLDAGGKPADGLPGKSGYFQMTVPKALFEGDPKSLELGWIDFYRN